MQANSFFLLDKAVQQLRQIIAKRVECHLHQQPLELEPWINETWPHGLVPPGLAATLPKTPDTREWIVLLLALVPHMIPDFFGSLIMEYLPGGGDFPEFGGAKGAHHRGILPTGETVQFVLAGRDLAGRMELSRLFDEDHFFYRNDILWLETVREGEPALSGRLILSPEWVSFLLTGREMRPRFSPDFPARLATTRMEWSDLVLHPFTNEQLVDVKRWMRYHTELEKDANLSRKINAGYRVLFYGPPGTGKTLTACLLGKEFGKDVYRVDLSQIVSKYIGETEKNLGKIFDRAQHQDWILFFDEADALFGKRTNVQSSHDKFANQEVSFLLQRIEDFPGLMILASNFKTNIDEAFLRRFHSIIQFPMPNAQERLKLWTQSLPVSIPYSDSLPLAKLAESYEISGASILNVVQYASLRALSREDRTLFGQDLIDGIRRELRKEEKTL